MQPNPCPACGRPLGPGAARCGCGRPVSATDADADDNFTRTAPPRPVSGENGPAGMLGGYRLAGLLGEGGMGVVYRAEDPQLGRPVALKVMRPEAATPAARARFLREARSMAALHHDHVAPVWHVGEDAGTPFIVMPLLEGETLSDRLKREGRLPVPEAVRIAREMAEGLAAAHAKGLVHRDIKPANVWMEAPKGRVRLLDFGLARAAVPDAADALTATGAMMGTPAYMAPEQARGEADHRADLFSLGCVLYEMLTGRKPFTGRDFMAVVTSVAVDEPPDAASLAPGLPPALAGLVKSLLAKDPAGRPATAEEVVERLSGRAEPPAKSRGPWFFVSAGAAVLLLALNVAAVWWATRPGKVPVGVPPSTEVEKQPTLPEKPPKAGPLVLKGHTERVRAVAFSPDGKRLASGGDDARLCVWDAETGDLVFRKEGLSEGVVSVAFDPDGKLLAAGEAQRAVGPVPVSLWDAATGELRRRIPSHAGANVSVAFSPDGSRLAVGGLSGPGVRIHETATGRETAASPKQSAPAFAAAFRAGGPMLGVSEQRTLHLIDPRNGKPFNDLHMPGTIRAVLFGAEGAGLAVGDDDGNVRVWDRGSDKPRYESDCRSPVRSLAWSGEGKVLSVACPDRLAEFGPLGRLLREAVFDPPPGPADDAALTPGGKRVAVGCRDGAVRVYRTE